MLAVLWRLCARVPRLRLGRHRVDPAAVARLATRRREFQEKRQLASNTRHAVLETLVVGVVTLESRGRKVKGKENQRHRFRAFQQAFDAYLLNAWRSHDKAKQYLICTSIPGVNAAFADKTL
jgi:hypothetical protein